MPIRNTSILNILGMKLFAIILQKTCKLKFMRYHLATNIALHISGNRCIVAISTCLTNKKIQQQFDFLGNRNLYIVCDSKKKTRFKKRSAFQLRAGNSLRNFNCAVNELKQFCSDYFEVKTLRKNFVL